MKSKKWLVQGIAILIFVVFFSVTVFAADQQIVADQQITAAETEKENPLEHSLYVRGQDEEGMLTSVSEEEWKELKKEGKKDMQKTAFVVFQPQKAPTEEVPQTDKSGHVAETETGVESTETNLPVSDEAYEKTTETQKLKQGETYDEITENQMSVSGEIYEETTEAQMSEAGKTYEETTEAQISESDDTYEGTANTKMAETDETSEETTNTQMLETNELPVKIPETEMLETSNPVQTVKLTKKHKKYIEKSANIFKEVVVIFNGCSPEDELCLAEYSNVIVKVLEKEVKETELEDIMKVLNIEETRNDYDRHIDEIKANQSEGSESESEKPVVLNKETRKDSGLEKISGTENPITLVEGGSQPAIRAASTNNDDTNTDNNKNKEITLTFTIDDLSAGEDMLTATCAISSKTEITNGKLTFTYDKNIMTLESADAEELEAFEDNDMTCQINDANNGAAEGTIEMTISSAQGVKLDGDMLYLYFDLNTLAKMGDVYEIKLQVNEMKNGAADLTTDVKQSTYTVTDEDEIENDDDEDDVEDSADDGEDESESETKRTQSTQSTQSTNRSNTASSESGTKTTTPPKTGDESNTTLWLIIGGASLLTVLYTYRKKRKA
ncbi:LPXTG cell wall anchor domain-containing protein [uncultured Robinsoniella sp.]|uniref:LPXTG cell wall anchor domain-containing protein n=1 Tax=uncultured Robinsoniella sp. TaxID=904190 RepID=UPI00374F6B0B